MQDREGKKDEKNNKNHIIFRYYSVATSKDAVLFCYISPVKTLLQEKGKTLKTGKGKKVLMRSIG